MYQLINTTVTTSLVALRCVIHPEQDVREEKHYMNVAQTSNNRVIMACELYCLLPQCDALRICRSGFSDRNTMLCKMMR